MEATCSRGLTPLQREIGQERCFSEATVESNIVTRVICVIQISARVDPIFCFSYGRSGGHIQSDEARLPEVRRLLYNKMLTCHVSVKTRYTEILYPLTV